MTRRRTAVLATLTVLGLAAVTAVAVTLAGATASGEPAASAESAEAAESSTGTARVERRDLVVTEELTGELGFGTAVDVAASREGIVTTVASQGGVVAVGAALFSVDLEPAVLMAGAIPAFRAMSTSSSDGPDVEQLEAGLVALGLGEGITVDEEFTAVTAAAVRSWEEDLGRADPDGIVDLGDVVFAAGPVRVAAVAASPGAAVQASTTVLRVTPTSKVVELDVEVDQADAVDAGGTVALTLPDGTQTSGTVGSVGSQAETNANDPQAAATVPVVIVLDDAAAAEGLDSGSVDVVIERSRSVDVLAVPVAALLALAEGGYAIEVAGVAVEGAARSSLVGVDVGTIADGYVEIEARAGGAPLVEGTEVVIPQ